MTATTELGFSVETRQLEDSLRGEYDASRAKRDHPQLVRLIEWLIALKFVEWDAIAKRAGVSWELVAAIAADRKESIREFKVRKAGELKLVLDAATPDLLKKAREGKLSVFDFKLLTDCFLLMAGEATAIIGTAEKEEDPDAVELRRMLAARPTPGMVLEAEEVSALGATAALPALGAGDLVRGLPEPSRDMQSAIVDSQHAEYEHA